MFPQKLPLFGELRRFGRHHDFRVEISLRMAFKSSNLESEKIGNINCISDAAVASEMAYSAAYGAYYNVRINLLDLKKEKSYSIHSFS